MKLSLHTESILKPTINLETTNQLLDYLEYESSTLVLDLVEDREALHNLINADARGCVNWDTVTSKNTIDGKAMMYAIKEIGMTEDTYLRVEHFTDHTVIIAYFKGSLPHKTIKERI